MGLINAQNQCTKKMIYLRHGLSQIEKLLIWMDMNRPKKYSYDYLYQETYDEINRHESVSPPVLKTKEENSSICEGSLNLFKFPIEIIICRKSDMKGGLREAIVENSCSRFKDFVLYSWSRLKGRIDRLMVQYIGYSL